MGAARPRGLCNGLLTNGDLAHPTPTHPTKKLVGVIMLASCPVLLGSLIPLCSCFLLLVRLILMVLEHVYYQAWVFFATLHHQFSVGGTCWVPSCYLSTCPVLPIQMQRHATSQTPFIGPYKGLGSHCNLCRFLLGSLLMMHLTTPSRDGYL